VAWHVVKELLVLGILVAILLSGHSAFETRVVALLVLIYNGIQLQIGRLGLTLSNNQVLMGDDLRNMGRSMKLKMPVMDLEASEQFGMGNLLAYISGISRGLGSLIAVVALISSLF
jgi:hypothetical protein